MLFYNIIETQSVIKTFIRINGIINMHIILNLTHYYNTYT